MRNSSAVRQGTDELSFHIDSGKRSIAAPGVDLKHATCLLQHDQARLNDVRGDLNDAAVYLESKAILDTINNIDVAACDLHPDLHATRLAEQLAERLDIPLIRVQHHHAHIAAVIAEHGVQEPVIGLAMDGYGYGSDGSAWGGECLCVESSADGGSCERVGCIRPVAMPGGDAASRQPWRMAVAWLGEHPVLSKRFDGLPVEAVKQLCSSANTPITSSAGRLFDAASAIVLGSREVSFEGEAAIALERAAAESNNFKKLSYALSDVDGGYQLDCSEALKQMLEGVEAGVSKPELAAGFHHMLASGMAGMAVRVAREKGVRAVALAGGCFLNRLLKAQITAHLEAAGLRVLLSEQLPQGDGAIALGQVWVAAQSMKRGDG